MLSEASKGSRLCLEMSLGSNQQTNNLKPQNIEF